MDRDPETALEPMTVAIQSPPFVLLSSDGILKDRARGKEILSKKMMLSVYTLTRFDFEISGKSMPPGTYKASLAFDAERPDLGEAALLILPKSYTVEFRLP